MAQVVIFSPSGEDVSAGEQALKDAGHDVEVVEATAENLLHMAIGMIGGKDDEEKKDDDEDKEDAEAAPAPEEDPLAEPAEETPDEPEEDPKKMESLGVFHVDGEDIEAFLGETTRLFVSSLTHSDKGFSFSINESQFYTPLPGTYLSVTRSETGATATVPARVQQSKFGRTYLQLSRSVADAI